MFCCILLNSTDAWSVRGNRRWAFLVMFSLCIVEGNSFCTWEVEVCVDDADDADVARAVNECEDSALGDEGDPGAEVAGLSGARILRRKCWNEALSS
jgi:hypothetical protein